MHRGIRSGASASKRFRALMLIELSPDCINHSVLGGERIGSVRAGCVRRKRLLTAVSYNMGSYWRVGKALGQTGAFHHIWHKVAL